MREAREDRDGRTGGATMLQPLMLRLTRNAAAFAAARPTLLFNCTSRTPRGGAGSSALAVKHACAFVTRATTCVCLLSAKDGHVCPTAPARARQTYAKTEIWPVLST